MKAKYCVPTDHQPISRSLLLLETLSLAFVGGDPHRRSVQKLLANGNDPGSILIVSPSLSIRVDLLSGVHSRPCGLQERHRPRQRQSYEIQLDAAEDAQAVRAFIWQEGREQLASNSETLQDASLQAGQDAIEVKAPRAHKRYLDASYGSSWMSVAKLPSFDHRQNRMVYRSSECRAASYSVLASTNNSGSSSNSIRSIRSSSSSSIVVVVIVVVVIVLVIVVIVVVVGEVIVVAVVVIVGGICFAPWARHSGCVFSVKRTCCGMLRFLDKHERRCQGELQPSG